jgi:hypothetical protein
LGKLAQSVVDAKDSLLLQQLLFRARRPVERRLTQLLPQLRRGLDETPPTLVKIHRQIVGHLVDPPTKILLVTSRTQMSVKPKKSLLHNLFSVLWRKADVDQIAVQGGPKCVV